MVKGWLLQSSRGKAGKSSLGVVAYQQGLGMRRVAIMPSAPTLVLHTGLTVSGACLKGAEELE